MQIDDLEYRLIRSLNIPYMRVKIRQPRLSDIDDESVGLLRYSSYKSLFTLRKEHLNMNEELIDITKDNSFFETLFIIDDYYMKQGLIDRVPFIDMLIMSLIFFLDVNVDTDKISKNVREKYIGIFNEQEQPIFILSNDNFEEFSELIRIICCCNMIEVESDKPKNPYKNESLRRKFEKIQRQNAEVEAKKRKENEITIADMIGLIGINEITKYKLNQDMDNLTIWQLNYIYNGMFVRESNEFTKMQFCSYKFSFEKTPSFNWIKETKVKLPEK